MAILRMLTSLGGVEPADLRKVFDTLRPEEEALSASDRWLSSLSEQEARARGMIRQIEGMVRKRRQ